MGPWGPNAVKKLVNARLLRLSGDDTGEKLKEKLANYLYHVLAGPGSGEYALSKVLQPGIF